jgi:hypothetical protein
MHFDSFGTSLVSTRVTPELEQIDGHTPKEL